MGVPQGGILQIVYILVRLQTMTLFPEKPIQFVILQLCNLTRGRMGSLRWGIRPRFNTGNLFPV